jgi:hypothetical protein
MVTADAGMVTATAGMAPAGAGMVPATAGMAPADAGMVPATAGMVAALLENAMFLGKMVKRSEQLTIIAFFSKIGQTFIKSVDYFI